MKRHTVCIVTGTRAEWGLLRGVCRAMQEQKELCVKVAVTGAHLSEDFGMTVDEAVPALEKYLDDAYLAHLPQVRVVHGRGTGALKAAVHRQLKKLKYVKEFRLGEFGEGDSGVTIVTFQ